jgi:hypothetical protein
MRTNNLSEYLKERDHLEVLGVNGKMILKWSLSIEWEGDWIYVTQVRDQKRAILYIIIIKWVP